MRIDYLDSSSRVRILNLIDLAHILSSFADTYDGGGGVPPRATAHFSAAEKCSKYVAVVDLEKLM